MITVQEIQDRAITPAASVMRVRWLGAGPSVAEDKLGALWLTVVDGHVQVFFHATNAEMDGRTVEVPFIAQQVISEHVGLDRAQLQEFRDKVTALRKNKYVYCVFSAIEWEGADLESINTSIGGARKDMEARMEAEEQEHFPREFHIAIRPLEGKIL